uniref:Uncharacterized protein n=1 Tax=Chromera velia CCMP2878 TaxID=1169474 RepID=A0A0G4HLI6_9ALVE|eukprot:Cvel_7361.t1-p1 / transcript=Cvel_7361.t1 / gene=Cvel_7361 / organism=Chromera_velia_CCMP2878 / gene_product=hypothetical protein / transcript_product=hypothetical protein / location=Cvel_scaffold382:41451-42125(-) / protein_length=93 / sequence_SO=supercontig / SO=protein_coding / is_pseudo=false
MKVVKTVKGGRRVSNLTDLKTIKRMRRQSGRVTRRANFEEIYVYVYMEVTLLAMQEEVMEYLSRVPVDASFGAVSKASRTMFERLDFTYARNL